MDFLGEYEKETMITLQLDIKRSNGDLIEPDEAPKVKVEYYKDGMWKEAMYQEMTQLATGRYAREFFIAESIGYSECLVSYEAKVGGKKQTAKEKFRVVPNNEYVQMNMEQLRLITHVIGSPQKDKTTLYDTIRGLKEEIELLKEKLRPYEVPEESLEKVKVSSKTLTLADGSSTRFLYNGTPMENVTVNAYVEHNQRKIFVERTKTDKTGHWEMMLLKREYTFEFVLPNRKVAYSFRRAV